MFLLKNRPFFILLMLSIVASASVYAAVKNTKLEAETIDIKSNYLLLDEKKGISIYKGSVLFVKGTLVIKADKITLYSDGEELIRAVIIGSPAEVRHQLDNEEKMHAQAKQIEYFFAKEYLILNGKAFIDQGNHHISGVSIEYDVRQHIITATGQKGTVNTKNSPPKRRVHVIIGPETENTEE